MKDQHQDSGMSATGERLEGTSARRKFLRTSGRAAIAAPAVVLLLSATTKSASAGVNPNPYSPTQPD
jgi:hypothetical protein